MLPESSNLPELLLDVVESLRCLKTVLDTFGRNYDKSGTYLLSSPGRRRKIGLLSFYLLLQSRELDVLQFTAGANHHMKFIETRELNLPSLDVLFEFLDVFSCCFFQLLSNL